MQCMLIALLLFTSFTMKTQAEDETTTWVKAGDANDIATIAANGIPVAITMTTSGDEPVTYALPTAAATKCPTAIVANKDETELTIGGTESEYRWTITQTTDGYTITNDEGQYLYTTNANNGSRVNNLPSNGTYAYVWTVSDDYLKVEDFGRYLGIYLTNPDWRTYTSNVGTNIADQTLEFWTLKDAGQTVPVESVSVSPTALELEVGQSEQLEVTVSPSNATNKRVSFASSNESVASVDAAGKVTALAVGNATITVASVDGSEKSASCSVTVKEVSLDDKTILDKFTEAPKDGSNLVIYYPTDEVVMTDTASGTGLAPTEAYWIQGKFILTDEMAYLTVSLSTEGDYTFTNAEGKYLTSGETGSSLFFAEETSDYSLWTMEQQEDGTWLVTNKNAKHEGTKPQLLEYYNGFTTYGYNANNASRYKFAFYGVQATTPDILVESLTLDKAALELELGKTGELTAAVLPGNASNPTLEWSSSNETVATVANGVITTLAVGTTTITAATTDGSELTASCVVTVKEVDLSNKTLYVKLNEAPKDGDLVAIYHPTSKKVLSTIASGSKLEGIEGTLYDEKLEILNDMAILSVAIFEETQGEGEDPLTVYAFIDANGKYLTSGATGNSLTFAEETSDYSQWILEKSEDGSWFIINKNAAYSNKKQAIEYYNDLFTTYSVGTGNAFKFELYGKEEEAQEILIESISVENLVMEIGESKPLEVTILPENATNKRLTYEVLDDDIVSVDENGLVTALKAGETAIFVSATDDSGCTNTAFVTVNPLPEGTVLLSKLTEAPVDGSTLVVYHPTSNNVLTAEASGAKLAGVQARFYQEDMIKADEMAVLTVLVEDDEYTFQNAEGKWLTAAATGNGLSFADEATEYSIWLAPVQQEDGTWYIINKNAKYTNNQGETLDIALEYYKGFTSYSIKNNNNAYKFEFYGEIVEEPESDYLRIYRESRLDESIKVADELKKVMGVEEFKAVVIAKDSDFADALSGSYLAARKEAPILLVNESNFDQAFEYIRNNVEPGMVVYILGGESAVSASFEEGLLDDPYSVIRIAGSSRYSTNLDILNAAGMSGRDIFVVTGSGYADSLSSASAGLPILMVDNTKTTLKNSQIKWLKSQNIRNIYVLGQEASVNKSLFKALKSYGTVTRIGGSSRWETTKLVADRFFPETEYVTLATGNDFADGLIASPLAYALKSPLLMVANGKTGNAKKYVEAKSVTKAYIVGSKDLISDETARKILLLDETVIILER